MALSISAEPKLSFKPLLPSSRTNNFALPSFRANPPSFFHCFNPDLHHLFPVSVQIPVRPRISKRLQIQAVGNTFARVASGDAPKNTFGSVASALKKISRIFGAEVLAYVSKVHKVVLPEDLIDHETLTIDQIESNIMRCPSLEYAEKMIAAIDAVKAKGDSVGGVVTCIVRNFPRGLGLPLYNRLEAELAKSVMSLPAATGFQFGSGFAGTSLTSSEHYDYKLYIDKNLGKIRARTNHSGGIEGGISNGKIINMAIAFKPTLKLGRKRNTETRDNEETDLHDTCAVPRVVPMVEAMVALVLYKQLVANLTPLAVPEMEPAKALSGKKMEGNRSILNQF